MIPSEAQRYQPSYVECPPFEDLEPVWVELAGAGILQLSGQPISAELNVLLSVRARFQNRDGSCPPFQEGFRP